MVVTASTEALAKRLLAEGGGIVGLGRYVYDLTTNAWGSCFAEVEVDMRTGQVDVLRLVVAHEIGRVLYPAGAEGQIHGGALQGLGYAMTEDLVLDRQSRDPRERLLSRVPAADVPRLPGDGPDPDRGAGHERAIWCEGPGRESDHGTRAGDRQCDLQRDRPADSGASLHLGPRPRLP